MKRYIAFMYEGNKRRYLGEYDWENGLTVYVDADTEEEAKVAFRNHPKTKGVDFCVCEEIPFQKSGAISIDEI